MAKVDLTQFPGISCQSSITVLFHVSACACSVCLSHSLSRKPWPLLRCVWSLRSGYPERNTYHLHCWHCLQPRKLHWCTLGHGVGGGGYKWGGIVIGPRFLEQPLKFVYSHGVCKSQCVRIKGRVGEGEANELPHPAFTQRDPLWGCWKEGFIGYWLFDLMLCLRVPSKRNSCG